MVMEAVVVIAETESPVPFHPGLLPVAEPVKLGPRFHEELHFHLLELAHAEDELTCHNLIPEGLAYLGYPEGKLHPPCLLHIEEVDKDTLGVSGRR